MLYDLQATSIDGRTKSFGDFRGQVLLIVNVASQCGFTPQYAGLETLYQRYKDQGFAILGFPCNQFGHQEPSGEAAIQEFCRLNYNVTFPMFAKIEVNGPQAHPLYKFLKGEKSGILGTEAIKWNFTKFLIDREGNVVKRYAPTSAPESIEGDIKKLLATH